MPRTFLKTLAIALDVTGAIAYIKSMKIVTETRNGHEHIFVDGSVAGQVWQGYRDWRAAPGGANQQTGTGSRMEAVEHCVATHLGDDIDDATIAAAQAALEAIA